MCRDTTAVLGSRRCMLNEPRDCLKRPLRSRNRGGLFLSEELLLKCLYQGRRRRTDAAPAAPAGNGDAVNEDADDAGAEAKPGGRRCPLLIAGDERLNAFRVGTSSVLVWPVLPSTGRCRAPCSLTSTLMLTCPVEAKWGGAGVCPWVCELGLGLARLPFRALPLLCALVASKGTDALASSSLSTTSKIKLSSSSSASSAASAAPCSLTSLLLLWLCVSL